MGAVADQVLEMGQFPYQRKILCLRVSFTCTTISVLFGLKDTQSSPLSMWEFWMVIPEERYVSHPSYCIILAQLLHKLEHRLEGSENTGILCCILARALPRNIDVIVNNIS